MKMPTTFKVGEQYWACGAYDHGPFCRLCQPVDDTLLALLELVERGDADWQVDPTGQFRFKLTEQGQSNARALYERYGLDPNDRSKGNLKAALAHLDEDSGA